MSDQTPTMRPGPLASVPEKCTTGAAIYPRITLWDNESPSRVCADLRFDYDETNPDFRVGINANGTPFRALDVGGDPTGVTGQRSNIRGGIEDTGRANGAVYNVKAYGAIGNGITDDTAAIRAAVATAIADRPRGAATSNGGATIYFPCGNYYVTDQILCTEPLLFVGAGAGHSIITFDGAGAQLYIYVLVPEPSLNGRRMYANGCEGLTFTRAERSIGAVVNVRIEANPASIKPLPFTRVIDCHFDAGGGNLDLIETYAFVVERNVFRSAAVGSSEIQVINATFPDAGDSTIAKNYFDNKRGAAQSIFHNGSGGLRILSNKFNGGAAGSGIAPLYHYVNQSTHATGILMMQGNSFENYSVAAILIANTAAWTVAMIQGNQITVYNNAYGIRVSNAVGVYTGSLNNLMIQGNCISGGGGASTGIYLKKDAGSVLNTVIQNNVFNTLDTGVQNIDIAAGQVALSDNSWDAAMESVGVFSSAAGAEGTSGWPYRKNTVPSANFTGDTSATIGAAGGAAALPVTPLGYTVVSLAGIGTVKIPYYNQ